MKYYVFILITFKVFNLLSNFFFDTWYVGCLEVCYTLSMYLWIGMMSLIDLFLFVSFWCGQGVYVMSFALWPTIWFIIVNSPCLLVSDVYSVVGLVF